MIKLAMELPTSKLRDWYSLTDLDFVLAHQVLQDPDYAEFHHMRQEGRELILDNSYHELGHPLSVADLCEACRLVKADYVIAPDRVNDVNFNRAQFQLLHDAQDSGALSGKIAVVMTGTLDGDAQERESFLLNCAAAQMLCVTYKSPPRLPWYAQSPLAYTWDRVHLLGISELKELAMWQQVAAHRPEVSWSLDTAKPLKWAMDHRRIDALRSVRHAPLKSAELLNLPAEAISPRQEQLFLDNVATLRGYLL